MIPAWHGEFGLRLRYHVPQAHALLGVQPQPVQIERGMEALYPRATSYVYADRPKDDDRHGSPPRVWTEEERFIPQPHQPTGVTAQVVIAPRGRSYGATKNWHHWETLLDLPGVFAAGAPDSSQHLDCPCAWDFNRPFLDASIEAINSAELVVASDSGIAHLAILCGTPLLLLTHHGRVSPGPVINSRGRKVADRYWNVRMTEYYDRANWLNVPIETAPYAWDEPYTVREAVDRLLA